LYDAIDRLLEIEQVRTGGTFETGFAYDPASAVSRITDPAAKQTDYLTDDLGRLVKVVSPDTGTTLYLHDGAGNTTSKIEAFGTGSARTTAYAYDGLDRLTLVDHPNDPDWVFAYDASTALNQKGRLVSVGNGIVTTSFEYTARGEVAVERTAIDGKSYTVGYGYDAAGNVASILGGHLKTGHTWTGQNRP
jgi:YD repeat-containing protein